MKQPRLGPFTQPLEVRFWTKVKAEAKRDGCWLWTGALDGKGYPVVWHNRKVKLAHRIAWEMRNAQPFPEGMYACHSCDNPRCVRPDHIFPGTDMDNHLDAKAKGRLITMQRRTHCQRGHAMTGDNVYENRGKRSCRECHRMSERARRNKGREIA